jgi:hypothetical protein
MEHRKRHAKNEEDDQELHVDRVSKCLQLAFVVVVVFSWQKVGKENEKDQPLFIPGVA